MKFCNQCGTKNTGNAKFCQECGNSLQSSIASPAPSAPAAYRFDAAEGPLLNLSHCVSQARSRLKELKQPIPPASSETVALMMGRLHTIAPDDTTARVEVIEALGRTRDPVALRALLLVAGAGSKHVRRAVAVALSGINHTLSAYILLPMLEDQSSRVRNSAIQALIYINQPHTAEPIISACLGNRELKRIAIDTVRRLRPMQRNWFVDRLSRVDSSGSVTASELIREFNSVADSLASVGLVNPVDRSIQPPGFPQEFVNSGPRALDSPHKSAPAVQHHSIFPETELNARAAERPIPEPAQPLVEQPPIQDRERLVTESVGSRASPSVQPIPADFQVEMPFPSFQKDDSAVRENEQIASRAMSSESVYAEPIQIPRQNSGGVAAETGAVNSTPLRIGDKSDDVVNHGIDVSALDDLAVSRLMAELVPESPGIRSSDSVADFRFFESVSKKLNDSRAEWQSPENSVFHYDPAPEFGLSDTQSLTTQNTNRSDFAFATNVGHNPRGSSASGRVPQSSGAGSSASWNFQPPMPPVGNPVSAVRPMNSVAGDHSLSGSHVFHRPQSLPAPPNGLGWPLVPQNQSSPVYQGPQAFPSALQAPVTGMSPQHFMPMPPQMAVPPASFPMPHMPTPAFPAMGTDPMIPLTNRSAEISTFGQPKLTAASVAGSFSQPAVSNAAPLSEDVLLNGGTMLEIPMLPPTGTTVATTDAQSTAPIELTVSPTVQPDDSEKTAKKAQSERNLERLRQARDQAFRVLLENQEAISGTVPRLISKKITALLTTPAGDHGQIKQQLVGLGRTGSPHVLETLASFCQKPVKEIRISCAEALGLVKHQGSVVQLLKFLGDKSGTVIETALKSMISLHDKAAYPVILAAGLVNSSLRTIVSTSIENVGEEFKPTWEQQLLSCLTLSDSDLVAFSIQLLVKLTGTTHVDTFLSFAENPEPVIRAAAIEALVKTGAKKVIGTINEALEDEDPLVRSQAANAVGTMHSPRSIDLLGKLLLDSNLSVRRSAAQSAAKVDESDLGDAIVAALKVETDHLVIEYLLEALNKNGGKNAYSLLVHFVEATDNDLRELALKALRKLKLQESIPVFIRLLDDKHAHIRKQAVEQLALLKSDAVIPRLKQLVKTDTDEHVRGACARALGDLQDKTSLDLLEAALEDHAVVRFQAVFALGKIGNSAAGPSLLALLRDSQPEIRYQAVRALGQLKLEGSEVHLEPLLQDSDAMVRRGVEQTLQDFGMSPSQIRRLRFQKAFSKAMLAISPSYIFAALPGKAGSAVAVLTMILAVGSVWLLSNVGSMVSGGSNLPVQRITGVAVSSIDQKAFLLRKMDVLDIVSTADGKLIRRVQLPAGTEQIVPEAKGGLLIKVGLTIGRLDPKEQYDASTMKTLTLKSRPTGMYFHQKSNTWCVFSATGGSTKLNYINGENLEESQGPVIAKEFKGDCVLSPDRAIALMIDQAGTLTLCELASGKIATADVAKMTKQSRMGVVTAVQFTDDMRHVCFCTSDSFMVLTVDKMKLVKHINDAGFIAVHSPPGTKELIAVTMTGKIYTFAEDLANARDAQIDKFGDLTGIDTEGKYIIHADSETRDAYLYGVAEKKNVAEILAE